MACLGSGNVAAETGHSCSNVWASADSRPEEGAHEAVVWNVRAKCNITIVKGKFSSRAPREKRGVAVSHVKLRKHVGDVLVLLHGDVTVGAIVDTHAKYPCANTLVSDIESGSDGSTERCHPVLRRWKHHQVINID
jgi:hypothetical protein